MRDFYFNKELREGVHNYLIDFLKERAIKDVFSGQDVTPVAKAKNIIDDAFENLEIMYAPKHKKSVVDDAR